MARVASTITVEALPELADEELQMPLLPMRAHESGRYVS